MLGDRAAGSTGLVHQEFPMLGRPSGLHPVDNTGSFKKLENFSFLFSCVIYVFSIFYFHYEKTYT